MSLFTLQVVAYSGILLKNRYKMQDYKKKEKNNYLMIKKSKYLCSLFIKQASGL